MRELVGELRGVQVGAEEQQALREVFVRLKLKEAWALLLVALVSDHVGDVSEVAQVFLEGADQAVVRVVVQGAVQLRVEVRLHEVQGDVARLFMLVVLGLQHVCGPEAFIGWVSRVHGTARCWVAPHGFEFSSRYDEARSGDSLSRGMYAIWRTPQPVGLPVLGRAWLAEWAPRRFALSTGVAPSMTFSSRSGLAKSAYHKGGGGSVETTCAAGGSWGTGAGTGMDLVVTIHSRSRVRDDQKVAVREQFVLFGGVRSKQPQSERQGLK